MPFQIVQIVGKQEVSRSVVDDVQAAHAIENWSSRFTDKPRTKYGMKITLEYVRALAVSEIGSFLQPIQGPQREKFLIERLG